MQFTRKEILNRFSLYPWTLDFNDIDNCYELKVEELDDYVLCTGIKDKRVAEYLLSIHVDKTLYTKFFTIEHEEKDYVDFGYWRFNYKLKTLKNLETNETKRVPHRKYQILCVLYNNRDRVMMRKELAFKVLGRTRYRDERGIGLSLSRLKEFLGGKHIEMVDSKRVRLNLE